MLPLSHVIMPIETPRSHDEHDTACHNYMIILVIHSLKIIILFGPDAIIDIYRTHAYECEYAGLEDS